MRQIWIALALYSIGTTCWANPWQDLATEDLKTIYDVIKTDSPGPVDSLNPGFHDWMDAGLKESQDMIKHVEDIEGYRYAIQHYVEGFNDGHLYFHCRYNRAWVRWPGFTVGLRDQKLIVHQVDKSVGLLKVGDQVVSCDGKDVEKLFSDNIDPFFSRIPTSSRAWNAPKIFADLFNPFVTRPGKCTFERAGRRFDVTLNWSYIEQSDLNQKLDDAAFGKKPSFSFSEFAPRKYWISIPTFGPEDDELKTMREFIAKLKTIRDRAELIVFDVRGNQGGSSVWGEELVESLMGEATMSEIRKRLYGPTKTEYRVSRRNLEMIRDTWPKLFEERWGKDSPQIKEAARLATEMEKSLKRGDQLVSVKDADEDKHEAKGPRHTFSKPIFLLTDARCGSACLDFADVALEIPNIIHVGGETFADSTYLEGNNVDPLPSQISALSYPMKVWRGRKRGNNATYVPKYIWTGDMSDTVGLRKWILGLNPKRTTR